MCYFPLEGNCYLIREDFIQLIFKCLLLTGTEMTRRLTGKADSYAQGACAPWEEWGRKAGRNKIISKSAVRWGERKQSKRQRGTARLGDREHWEVGS